MDHNPTYKYKVGLQLCYDMLFTWICTPFTLYLNIEIVQILGWKQFGKTSIELLYTFIWYKFSAISKSGLHLEKEKSLPIGR